MERKRWNVVFVITDQQRAAILETESKHAVYLNMERLCRESIRFSNCYTAAVPCGDSRNNYLTGKEHWTDILREHGYRFVKEHFRLGEVQETDETYSNSNVFLSVSDAIDQFKDKQPFAMVFRFHSPNKPYVKTEHKFKVISDAASDSYDYHSNMKIIDYCLEIIIKNLEKLNLLENSLLVYTSDQGYLLGEQCIFNKAGSFYENEVRVPLLIRFPDGFKAGKSISSLVSTIDFIPTLLDILGIYTDVSLPGYSLMPSINEGIDVRDYVTCIGNGAMMLRDKRYKFWYDSITEDGEMYDLDTDPMEQDNLYGKAHCFEQQFKMMVALLKARLVDDARNNRPLKQKAVEKKVRW